jgi:hypothetical protein
VDGQGVDAVLAQELLQLPLLFPAPPQEFAAQERAAEVGAEAGLALQVLEEKVTAPGGVRSLRSVMSMAIRSCLRLAIFSAVSNPSSRKSEMRKTTAFFLISDVR